MTTPVFIDTMMRGTSRVRKQIVDYFENNLELYINTLRNQNDDLNEFTLPYPQQYLIDDPFDTGTHTYPIVGAYITTTNGMATNVSYLPSGSQEYDTNYDVTIFVMVETPYIGQDENDLPIYAYPNRSAAMQLRDDYMAATRACLLAGRSLGTAGTENRLITTPGTIREEYPAPMKAGQAAGSRWICSGLIHIEVTATERMANAIIGTVQEINLDTDVLPFE